MVGMNDASANALKWQMKFVKVRLVGTRVHGYATTNHCFFLVVVGACTCFTLCTTSLHPTHTLAHTREMQLIRTEFGFDFAHQLRTATDPVCSPVAGCGWPLHWRGAVGWFSSPAKSRAVEGVL